MHLRAKLLCLVLSISSIAVAAPREMSRTGARHLWIERDVPRAAAATIVGRAIPLGPQASAGRRVAGGEIVWKKLQELPDETGRRHVFYRQYLVLDSGEEAELVGGEIAVHHNADGSIYFINGAQFETVALANARKLGRTQVQAAARAAVRRARKFVLESEAELTNDELTARENRSQLILLSDGTGRRFRFAYSTPVRDAWGLEYTIDVDAETGELLDAVPTADFDNCNVSNPGSQSTATGVPIRSGVPTRTNLTVSPATRTNGYQWEAFYAGTTNYPQVLGHQIVHESTGMTCYTSTYGYTVFPVKNDRVFDLDGIWQGRIMGDLIHKTRQTMQALYHQGGRRGWDGNNGRANIFIQEVNPAYVNNMAFYSGAPDTRKLQHSLVLGVTDATWQGTSLAAALDVVAHEWGHGILRSRNISGSPNTVAGQIHEGFADVIGHIAEKYNEPPGSGVEQSSDWKIGEDASPSLQALRNAAVDDGHYGHTWNGITFNDRFHKDDQPMGPSMEHNHERGNQLAVAYKMLWTGGVNPACGQGLGCTNMTGTATAPRIMIRTFGLYITSAEMVWEQIANVAARAAFDFYNKCNDPWGMVDPATIEQRAVEQAFANIGWPRTQPFINCP